MSKTISLHHIVFATKSRRKTIPESHKRDLYAYIYGIIKKNKCFIHRINGIPNHIHILTDIHPTICLADLMKDVKQGSTNWLRRNPDFPDFDRWADGYYAASLGVKDLEACKQYIIDQEKHHFNHDFEIEMEHFAKLNGLTWYPDDLA